MLNYSANGPSGYNLTNSLRLRRSASATLTRTPSVSGNQKTWTFSFWYKRGLIGSNQQGLLDAYVNSGNLTSFNINNDTFNVQFYSSGSFNTVYASTAVFRDPSAWYHVVLTVDTTQVSQSNMVKLYVNGIQQTFPYTNYEGSVPQNTNTYINASGVGQYIGVYVYNGSYQDGYLAEVNFIDGQALTPSSFGNYNSATGVWQPKKYTGTYGTNGFYLNFSNIALTSGSNTGLGKDYSGNGNYWNTNNISVTAGQTYDAMTDVPTLTSTTVANYATLNPLSVYAGTFSAANLQYVGANSWYGAKSTIQIPSTGKFYAEATFLGNALGNGQGDAYAFFGVCPTDRNPAGAADGNNLIMVDSGWYYNFVAYPSGTNTGSAFSTGNVLGLAIDRDANTFTFYKNNVSVATGTIGTTAGNPLVFCYGSYNSSYGQMAVNFGQRPFAYTAPSGYLPLNTYNLPTSTIVQGNKYMDASLYTGTRATQVVTNTAGFQPDMVWCRGRSFVSQILVSDSVRGTTKQIFTPLTIAEQTDSTMITSFNSNGFTLGDNSGGPYGNINYNIGASYVGWQWQAGQGSTSTNTSGSITSTVSVNASAGFSIVTYTGTGSNATVGHGLGVAPKFIIIKRRNGVTDWPCWHTSISQSSNYAIDLNRTAATYNTYPMWNGTSPTSSVFSIGVDPAVNASGGAGTYVAYCWAEIAGFSKFGSYTGNGSADGPFVYTGFRPKWVMIKLSSVSGENWYLLDSVRNTYNPEDKWLIANGSDAEGTVTFVDFLSNGFKVRSNGNYVNYPSGTLIYAAFAENPFRNSLAR